MGLTGLDIAEGVREEKYLLRITDRHSMSPLTDNGFTATSNEFANMSNNRFARTYSGHLSSNWLNGSTVLEDIVDHITGGWSGGRGSPSDWISTSTSFEWAIWEAARRLTTIPDCNSVQLTVINRTFYSKRYRGAKPMKIEASELIENHPSFYPLNTHRMAFNFATASSEILYYGRIFDRDIEHTVNIRRDNPGMFLPRYMYQSPQDGPFDDWIDRLVWDTRCSFSEADRLMDERYSDL